MTPILALWLALFAAPTSVRGVSVLPAEGRTEIVVEFDGAVTVKDFRIGNPERLVLDVSGARQTLPRNSFPDIKRGGVRSLRVSQFQPEVVRLVFDLKEAVDYSLDHQGGVIRLSFPNREGPFSPWHAGSGAAARASTPATPPAGAASAATPAPAPAEAAAPSEPATGSALTVSRTPIRRVQPPITIFFKETPINDVIATFAEHSGRSIVVGQGVTGSVNADIRGQPWDVAMAALLSAYGLSAQEMESGIIRVDKIENLREAEKVEELITRPFSIKYASVDSLLPAVKGLLSGRGNATASSATNTIVVTDGRSIVEGRVAPMIDQLDARTPQVEIAAKIIFINRSAMDQLGVSYDLQDRSAPIAGLQPGTSIGLTGNAIAALGNATKDARVTGPTFQFISSLVIGRHRLNTFIDALTSVNAADIEARPVVRTLDHREATVQVGEETPIRVVDEGQGGSAPPRSTVQLKNTGIILKVTPHVTGNQVLLDVHAERSGVRIVPEADIGMIFDKQESKVQVLVNNGETAVISGLTISEKNTARLGVPILKDLPVLGFLFRKTLNEEVKKDLLIMVTPHIIREEG
jgi:type IV pilus secretin PilQ/predicted competence protein